MGLLGGFLWLGGARTACCDAAKDKGGLHVVMDLDYTLFVTVCV